MKGQEGYNTAYEEGKGVGYLKVKEGKDTAYEEGKGVGYLKGKESLTAASSEKRRKRQCPFCSYGYLGVRQHCWDVHKEDVKEEDCPFVQE